MHLERHRRLQKGKNLHGYYRSHLIDAKQILADRARIGHKMTVFVPKGLLKIARRFNGGMEVQPVLEGRLKK
jgi:hypothetical protein